MRHKVFDGIEKDELFIKNYRYCTVRNSHIKTLTMINCQNCLIIGNTLGTLLEGNDIPEFNDKRLFRKLRKKRYRNKFGSKDNFITGNIALGDKYLIKK